MKSRKDVSPSVSSKKLLIRRGQNPLDPNNKFNYQISDELLPDKYKSCNPPTDTSRQDGAVASTVIRSDGCCTETWKRKELYYAIKVKVERAVNVNYFPSFSSVNDDENSTEHKVFLIRGDLPALSSALEARGWIPKYESVKTRMLPYECSIEPLATALTAASLEIKCNGNILQNSDKTLNEKALIFTFLRNTKPNFIWDCRNDFDEWDSSLAESNTLLNRLQKSSVYTSKLGMAAIVKSSHWHHRGDNVSTIKYPRSYSPSSESKAFHQEFCRCAAIGLLKWLVSRIQSDEEILAADGAVKSISINNVEFAIEQCDEFLLDEKYDCTNGDDVNSSGNLDEKWNLFLDSYSRVLHDGYRIADNEEDIHERVEKSYLSARVILKKLKEIDPEYELSGMRNIWILKPSDLCCGEGIIISHCIKDIFRKVETKPMDYFIVQKYIENPLLIHGTKFDIRLWYLVSCTYPLTIWIFEDTLLRFSSKPFSFSTYHEAIHLCNTAIQQKYDYEKCRKRMRGNLNDETIDSIRDQGWDCARLNEYLKQQGYKGEPFYDIIFKKMSESIVQLMLTSQDHLDRRNRSFELFGADFMVLEDLTVCLIEINTNPRMHPPSSKISYRLYTGVLESLIKVILDRPINPCADTGGFKLAFKQNIPEFMAYYGLNHSESGKSMSLNEELSQKNEEKD